MQPIWLRNYQPGVPHTIDPDKFGSLNAMFDWCFSEYKDLPAFCNMGQILSYAQVDTLSRNFTAFLHHKLGIVKGDRFAIMMPNTLHYPIAMIGILRAGAIVVNVNILFNEQDFLQQMQNSQATALIITENYAHIAAKVLAETNIKHVIVAKFSDFAPPPKALLMNIVLKYIKHKVPAWHFKTYYQFKDVLKIGAKLPYAEVTVTNNDIALLQYTGGTTGIPKGAMLTHRNIQANIQQLTAWMLPLVEPRHEIIVTILPLFHISAVVSCFFVFMYNGGLNILITNPLDTKEFVKAVKPYKFTAIAGVNRLFSALLNEPEFAKLDFSKLKTPVSSGMAVQPAVAVRWKKVTKKTLIQAYSQTETSLGISSNPLNSEESTTTVGLPIPSTEISIRNDLGQEFDLNHPGEIWVRGPQVMAGYWQNETATKEVLTEDGWFKTGDVGMLDDNGFLKLIDRKKDVIYIMGFQVFPSEVETVITNMPQAKEAAVVEAFDEVYGEIVKAYVVPNDPNLTEEQVINYCKEHLPYYKVPKAVEFRKDLPKNSIGKILRRTLRSENWTFG